MAARSPNTANVRYERFCGVFSRHLNYLIPLYALPVVAAHDANFIGVLSMLNRRAEAKREKTLYVENHPKTCKVACVRRS